MKRRARNAGRSAYAVANRRKAMRRRTNYYRNKRRRTTYDRENEMKYVDGFKRTTTMHEATGNDDNWADCELNPDYNTGGVTTYGCMPMPSVGTGYSNRNGRKIFVDNIKIRGIINFEPETDMAASTTCPFIRLLLVHDNKTEKASLNAEDVVGVGVDQAGNASGSANANICVLTNPAGWSRYTIVKDKYYIPRLQSGMATCTDVTAAVPIYGEKNGQQIPFKMTIKPKMYVTFDGTTGVVGSVLDNSWHLLGIKSDTSGSATISYVVRTAFKG